MRCLPPILLGLLLASPSADARRVYHRHAFAHAPGDNGVLLAEFTTRFDPDKDGRAANVRLSARRLGGLVIPPYQKMSYNQVVGPRTEEAGFRPAPVIARGRLRNRWGGGVCQASSTLHAAALLAGLTIVRRWEHSWRSHYIAPGLDAAVTWRAKDLILKNPYPFPIRVDVREGLDHINVRLVGAKPRRGWNTVQTRIVSTSGFGVVTEINPKMRPGARRLSQRGMGGAVVARHRSFHTPDGKKRREKLGRDVYYPKPLVIQLGPRRGAKAAGR